MVYLRKHPIGDVHNTGDIDVKRKQFQCRLTALRNSNTPNLVTLIVNPVSIYNLYTITICPINNIIKCASFNVLSNKLLLLIIIYILSKSNNFHLSVFRKARFSKSQRKHRLLICDGYSFIMDGKFSHTVNWRCSQYRTYRCKARAITKEINGVETYKFTNSKHTHEKIKDRI